MPVSRKFLKCRVLQSIEIFNILGVKNTNMDEKDILILKKLVKNSRTTLAELGEILDMSVSSVHKRIKKLEKEGVIERYTISLNPDLFECVTAFVLIGAEDIEEVVTEARKFRDIIEIYQALGNFNIVLKIRSDSLEKIGRVTSALSNLKSVMMLECIITTKRIKEDVWYPEVPEEV